MNNALLDSDTSTEKDTSFAPAAVSGTLPPPKPRNQNAAGEHVGQVGDVPDGEHIGQ